MTEQSDEIRTTSREVIVRFSIIGLNLKSTSICPANSVRLSRVRLGLLSGNSLFYASHVIFFLTCVDGTSLIG